MGKKLTQRDAVEAIWGRYSPSPARQRQGQVLLSLSQNHSEWIDDGKTVITVDKPFCIYGPHFRTLRKRLTMIKRILFVCTGNVCRSPMAKALFEDVVNKHPSLGPAGLEVDSAGTAVVIDAATAEATEIMREYGLSLAGHRSKRVSASLVDWADLILAMEFRQRVQVVSQFPVATQKTYILSEYVGDTGDVADPYGCDIEAYRGCAALLQRLLNKVAERLKS